MFQHVASLKRILDKDATAGDPSAFICLGDLNTMGLSAAYNDVSDLKEDQEIQFLEKRMTRVKMRRLSKTYEASWWNGKDNYQPAKLDHVFAAEHLKFKKFGNSEVEVIGWPQEPTKNNMRDWIEKYSDHALLYGEIIA
jgi:endonuclease/exonuclease/phosphatase family metal-dependent hydrolase